MLDATQSQETHIDIQQGFEIFESIIASSKCFVYRCKNDADYTMQFMSGCVKDVTGYRKDQILNNSEVGYVSLCHPDDAAFMVERVDLAIEARVPWDVDYRLVHPDGSLKWVRERGDAVYDADGQMVYLQGIVADAAAEVALRDEMDKRGAQTLQINHDILQLAQKISNSVRQLGMLSINARIEAARAGQAGLGFAVVASEINTLAKENAEWADQIASRMNE